MPSRRAPTSAPRDRPGAVPATVAARLYALPPDRFLAAREALAGRLAEGHDPLAAAVRQLRRPVGLAWMLDHLALAEPAGVEMLLRAGDRLWAGQQAALEGKGADALHAAEAEVREAARALRLAATPAFEQAGRRPEAVVMAHLEVLLRALATAPEEERSRFENGLLEREPQVGAFEGFSGLAPPPAAAPPMSEPAPAGAAPGAAPAAEAREAGEARLADEAELRREHEELERKRAEELRLRAEEEESRRREELERQRAEAEARERARRLAEARRALSEAGRAVEEQRALVEQRRAAAEAAQRRLDAAHAELARAEAALETAGAEANRARDAVQRLGGRGGDTAGEAAAPSGPQ